MPANVKYQVFGCDRYHSIRFVFHFVHHFVPYLVAQFVVPLASICLCAFQKTPIILLSKLTKKAHVIQVS
jgi:hypothetical protein